VQRRIAREKPADAPWLLEHDKDFLMRQVTREFGTPGYMPPEQAQRGVVSPASDIYALGATLRQLFPRWRARSVSAPPVVAAIDELLTAMTARDLSDRPPTMAAVHDRLQQLLEEIVR